MPIHYFICDKCNITITDTTSKGMHKCPKCNSDMRWDLSNLRVRNDMYGNTKWSDAVAISPDQIEEHKNLFPDIKVDPEGRIGFDGYKQEDNYYETCGFVKHPQKIK